MASYSLSVGTIIFTYYPLCLTCTTTILNSLTLIILYQNVFRQRPTILYMRAITLIDIVLLYGWNLDHFFRLKYGFEVDRLTVLSCKLSTYLNHVFNQSSAWLRVCMCIDRFTALNQIRHCQTHDRYRRVIISIVFTFIIIALINLHLPIFACYSDQNSTRISGGSLYFRLYPSWNYINLALYNIIPFILMLTFNILIIRQLILIKRTSLFQQSRIQHSSISMPILLSTFLFCIMTTPPALIFAFYQKQLHTVIFRTLLLSLLDSIKYTYHSLSFLLYFITLAEFRKEFFHLLKCQFKNTSRSSQNRNTLINSKSNQYRTTSLPISMITK